MLTAERNDLITRSGPGTPLGAFMRQYWQPAALVDELEGPRPGQAGSPCWARSWCCSATRPGAMGCWTGIAPTAAPTCRSAGRRTAGCAARSTAGCSPRTAPAWSSPPSPRAASSASPSASPPTVARRQRHRVRLHGQGGAARLARPSTASPRPDAYTFAFKGMMECNWLQALEVGIDPAHASYLHRFFEDESTERVLRQAVPRRHHGRRHADDQDPARIRPAAHRGRDDRVRHADRGAAPAERHGSCTSASPTWRFRTPSSSR